jgi:hypothetical protein
MKIGDLYGFVLTLVLVGLVLGIGLIILGKTNDAVNTTSPESAATLGNATTAISPIAETWMAIIVIIGVTAIILGLVINSFRGKG